MADKGASSYLAGTALTGMRTQTEVQAVYFMSDASERLCDLRASVGGHPEQCLAKRIVPEDMVI